jgi:hypothetical protein
MAQASGLAKALKAYLMEILLKKRLQNFLKTFHQKRFAGKGSAVMRGIRVSDYKSLHFLPSPCSPSLPFTFPFASISATDTSFTAVFPAVSATIFYSELKSDSRPSSLSKSGTFASRLAKAKK